MSLIGKVFNSIKNQYFSLLDSVSFDELWIPLSSFPSDQSLETCMMSCDIITYYHSAMVTDVAKTRHALCDTRYCTIMFPQCI
jgi:hypothetical protein